MPGCPSARDEPAHGPWREPRERLHGTLEVVVGQLGQRPQQAVEDVGLQASRDRDHAFERIGVGAHDARHRSIEQQHELQQRVDPIAEGRLLVAGALAPAASSAAARHSRSTGTTGSVSRRFRASTTRRNHSQLSATGTQATPAGPRWPLRLRSGARSTIPHSSHSANASRIARGESSSAERSSASVCGPPWTSR